MINKSVSFFGAIRTCSNILKKNLDALCEEHFKVKITGIEMIVLSYCLDRKGKPIVSNTIRDLTKVSKATMSQTLTSLVNKGLLWMRCSQTDHRTKNIYLTPRGIKVTETLENFVKETRKAFEEGISQEEKEVTLRVLKKMQDNAEALVKKETEKWYEKRRNCYLYPPRR